MTATFWKTILSALLVGIAANPVAANPVVALDPPIAGSPGSESNSEIPAPCPTFSWGSVEGARTYEIVVYLLAGDESAIWDLDEIEVVLRREFAGSIHGWTPPLDACFQRGRRYAWTIRAVLPEGPTEWSAPRLFRVAPGPSEEEVTRAFEVLRELLRQREIQARFAGTGDPRETTIPDNPRRHAAGPTPVAPRSHAGSGGAIVVDGATVETRADPPCVPSLGDPDQDDRFIDCGNGTVHDTFTGLLWLKDANCPGEALDWFAASAFAATLADGQCGLTDHSQPGDWRLPRKAELESLFWDTCTTDPEIAGRDGDCYSDSQSNAWAVGVVHGPNLAYWSSTTDEYTAHYAWTAYLASASFSSDWKPVNTQHVWPVREGR